MKTCPRALGFESLDPFFRVSKTGPYFIAIEEDGGDTKLAELKPACSSRPLFQTSPYFMLWVTKLVNSGLAHAESECAMMTPVKNLFICVYGGKDAWVGEGSYVEFIILTLSPESI